MLWYCRESGVSNLQKHINMVGRRGGAEGGGSTVREEKLPKCRLYNVDLHDVQLEFTYGLCVCMCMCVCMCTFMCICVCLHSRC